MKSQFLYGKNRNCECKNSEQLAAMERIVSNARMHDDSLISHGITGNMMHRSGQKNRKLRNEAQATPTLAMLIPEQCHPQQENLCQQVSSP